ncbi:MAG: hypothetical protein KDD22_04585, partial [Bdellovibrionales bacterium]|nr:hypothetical protein [Bdellovibrionales bacterium]
QWKEWDRKKRALENELKGLIEKTQDASKEAQKIEKNIQGLTEKKSQAERECREKQDRLSKIALQVVEAEKKFESQKQKLTQEQGKIRQELQYELQKMKTVFDTRKMELNKINDDLKKQSKQIHDLKSQEEVLLQDTQRLEDKKTHLNETVQKLEARQKEFEKEISNRDKLMEEIREEAEAAYVERQNDLLKDQENLMKLSEKRTLEVEMEMAELKIKRTQDLEKVLEEQSQKARLVLQKNADQLIDGLSLKLQQTLSKRIKEDRIRGSMHELIQELPNLVKSTLGFEVSAPTAVKATPTLEVAAQKRSLAQGHTGSLEAIDEDNDLEEMSHTPLFQRKIFRGAVISAGLAMAVLALGLKPELGNMNLSSLQSLPDSYVERSLNVPKYVDFERDSEVQKKWRDKLNAILVVEHGLSMNHVNQFIAQERTLMERLVKAQSEGSPKSSQEMQELESTFEGRVAEIFGPSAPLLEINKAKEQLYVDYMGARQLSSDSE